MKKILIAAIFVILILSIPAISATDNIKDDIVSTDYVIEDIDDDVITEKTSGFNTLNAEEITNALNIDEDDDILLDSFNSSVNTYEGKDIISASNDGDDSLSLSLEKDKISGSSLPSAAYEVNVSDVTMYYGANKTIWMSISTSGDYSFKYDFYFQIYDSNNDLKINTRYSGSTTGQSLTYKFNNPSLETGVYTIKIVNSYDNQVMDSATLTIKSVPYSAYSVKVNDRQFKSHNLLIYI